MYEYKVDIYKVKYAEEAMNTLAKDRWRVIAISPDHHTGFIDVFYEREKLAESDDDAVQADGIVSASVAVTEEEVIADRAAFDDDDELPADDIEENDVEYAVKEDIWDYDERTESEDDQ